MNSTLNLNYEKLVAAQSIDSLAFADLSFSYVPQGQPIFKSLNFDFPVFRSSNFSAVDGSGKSTLMSIFALMQNPTSGAYLINGVNVAALSFEEQIKFKWNVGYCFENEGLLNNQSLEGNLLLPLRYHKMYSENEIQNLINHYFSIFELDKYRHERPANVSFRVRKLIAMIRAWIHYPQLLIIDEPTMGLSEKQVDLVSNILMDQINSKSLRHFYFSSSDRAFCKKFSAHDIHIKDGKLSHGVVEQVAVGL